MKRFSLYLSLALFVGIFAVVWATQGTGVIEDDPERSIAIPKELTTSLQVKAAYDGENIYFRYRWPVDRPSIFHDVLVYQDGKWVKRAGDEIGPDPDFLTEDRVAMMIDDGSVPLFGRYGGYITIGEGLTTFTGVPETDEERTKYLPATRTDPNSFDTVKPESDLETLRKAGYFLDLWQWRSNRSNPIALGDDGFVAEERSGDEGTGPYFTNWDKATNQPKFMFDPALTGKTALNIDDVIGGKYGFDDVYYLSPETAAPFDPNIAWKNGDTIPRRVLRAERGSRADVVQPAAARWADGFWDVTLVRKMDTGNTLDDKIFRDGGAYNLAFAVFRNASTMRWHYVSLPVSLGLGRDAELAAVRFDGGAPNWEQPWFDMTLFYPGQVSWPMLVDRNRHEGAEHIEEGVPVKVRHSEKQLALYGVEVEFKEDIKRQWFLTLLAGLGLIVAFGVAVNLTMTRKEG
jgi:Ethylbenzene dehydrogenase